MANSDRVAKATGYPTNPPGAEWRPFPTLIYLEIYY
jgi:hypothetical protein